MKAKLSFFCVQKKVPTADISKEPFNSMPRAVFWYCKKHMGNHKSFNTFL